MDAESSDNALSTIGDLTLRRVLGQGGMGLVYEAWDPSLNRLVALKVLRRDRDGGQELLVQLEQEAVLCASVNHPNVGRVFRTGWDGDQFYIVMELIPGGSLDDRLLREERINEAEVLNIALDVARGLQAGANVGLVHRDVKPGNILFPTQGGAKLVDFGLAGNVSESLAEDGSIVGTAYYLPPERVEGGTEDIRSDIYALGATLFHALAGRPPYEAPTPADVAMKHVQGRLPSLLTFASHVSNTTASVVHMMLQRLPENRYQTYDELIEHLTYALDQLMQRATSGEVRVVEHLAVQAEEEQKWASYFVLVALALCLIIPGWLWLSKRGSDETPSKVAKTEETDLVAEIEEKADRQTPEAAKPEKPALVAQQSKVTSMPSVQEAPSTIQEALLAANLSDDFTTGYASGSIDGKNGGEGWQAGQNWAIVGASANISAEYDAATESLIVSKIASTASAQGGVHRRYAIPATHGSHVLKFEITPTDISGLDASRADSKMLFGTTPNPGDYIQFFDRSGSNIEFGPNSSWLIRSQPVAGQQTADTKDDVYNWFFFDYPTNGSTNDAFTSATRVDTGVRIIANNTYRFEITVVDNAGEASKMTVTNLKTGAKFTATNVGFRASTSVTRELHFGIMDQSKDSKLDTKATGGASYRVDNLSVGPVIP